MLHVPVLRPLINEKAKTHDKIRILQSIIDGFKSLNLKMPYL